MRKKQLKFIQFPRTRKKVLEALRRNKRPYEAHVDDDQFVVVVKILDAGGKRLTHFGVRTTNPNRIWVPERDVRLLFEIIGPQRRRK